MDDILPSGAEGGEIGVEPLADEAGLVGEADGLMDAERSAGPAMPGAAIPAGAGVAAAPGMQMVAIAPEDPASTLYGMMMFLPVLALVLGGIILTAAIQDVTPSLTKALTEKTIADVSLIWYVVGGMALVVLVFWALTAVGGEKSAKPAKDVYEKKSKKKKK